MVSAGLSYRRVEDGRGGLGHAATLRFPSPLIKPDVRISRIRLSDWFHRAAHGGAEVPRRSSDAGCAQTPDRRTASPRGKPCASQKRANTQGVLSTARRPPITILGAVSPPEARALSAARIPGQVVCAAPRADLRWPRHLLWTGAPMHLLVDSTGLKLYGAGEWLVRSTAPRGAGLGGSSISAWTPRPAGSWPPP